MTSTPIFDALAAELHIAGMSFEVSCAPADQTAVLPGREERLSGRLAGEDESPEPSGTAGTHRSRSGPQG